MTCRAAHFSWVCRLGLVLALGLSACARSPASLDRVEVKYQDSAMRYRDGRLRAWATVPVYSARLEPQDIVAPRLEAPGVEQLQVQALHDGHWIVFRLSWHDPSEDLLTAIGRFSDAVAVQVPATPGEELPDFAMGSGDRGVVIHQWKAIWQEAEAGRVHGVTSFYPNAWSDGYIPEFADNAEDQAALERTYTTSLAAGNPLAHAGRAARDLLATGFGALEPDEEQSTFGQGFWERDKWVVTLVRPLARHAGALAAGDRTYLALAVWDGSHGETGARKMVTSWIPAELEVMP